MSTSQILVVEDEGIVATAIKNELEQFGYYVPDIASSADEAIEMAFRRKPDLVLMDIHLAGEKDGIEAAHEINAYCGIPIVYLSAFADPETVARAGETEAFGYLVKPYEERELQTTIEMALAKHRAEYQLAEAERWLAAILEGVDDAVIATDSANQVRFMNLGGEVLTGWRKEAAVGVPLTTVCNLVEERGRIALEELADTAVRESRSVELPATARLVARNGQKTPVEGSLSPIIDPRGEFLGVALTVRSIRARLELEHVRQQPGNRPTILLADAEPMVRDVGRQILESQGYQVLVAEDGIQAVETFRQAPERFDLVIVDLNIPSLAGDAVRERLLELDPNVEVLFSSGYFAEDRCEGGSQLQGVIGKPYLREELVGMVELALGRRSEGGR
jgi:PAS domain S-box-containing protein